MAFNYKCGQFDDSFSPKRLGNWGDAARSSRCLKTRRGVYFRQRPRPPQHQKFSLRHFIANDCGHLLPDVKATICKKTNHWGFPVVGIWDELFQCCDGYTKKKLNCEKEYPLGVDDMPQYFRGRSPLAVCANAGTSILDDCNMNYSLDLEFERLQSRCPPVIWIYGQPQKGIEEQRLRFSGGLAKKLGFVYINPERVMTVLAMRYLHYSPRKNNRAWYWNDEGDSGDFFNLFTELPTILLECPPSIQRIVALLQNIVCNQPSEAFNTRGILEVIKLLFVTFPSARGYVLDGFPTTLTEADEYETEFWPVASGIYFTSEQWRGAKKRGCNPATVNPSFFLRSNDYLESLVEATASEFGESCITLDNAECLNHRDFCYIVDSMKDIIKGYNCSMCQEEIEFEWDEECHGPKPESPESEEEEAEEEEEEEEEETESVTQTDTTPFSESEPASSLETPLEEPPSEQTKEDSDSSEEESSEPMEDVEPDLERFVLEGFETAKRKNSIKHKDVKAFYQYRRMPYSHDIPDKAGIETQFGTGFRHRHVANVLGKEPRKEGPPLSGKLFLPDPAKPDSPLPRNDNKLFAEAIGGESDSAYLDDKEYVQKALALEKEKLKKDLADRKYRKKLSYTTYVSEPPANPETVHTLYPPERQDLKHDDDGKGHEEEENSLEQMQLYDRASKLARQGSLLSKKTLFDKVKGKWVKFRRYIKPVPRQLELVSGAEKVVQYDKEHPTVTKKMSRRHRKKRAHEEMEFRYG